MSSQTAPAATTEQNVGCFLYGMVPADVEPTADARGLGDPPGRVSVVTHGEIGALVSEIELDQPLGRPDDLVAYKELLDGTALEAPVLPVRFGTVLASREAVAELLAAQQDGYLAVLAELEGRVQYVVHGRYVEQALLTEVLEGNPEAASLRDQLRGQPEEATVDIRIRLGELINQAIEAKRAADTQLLVEALTPAAVASVLRPATHEQDAAHVAFLVETDRRAEFEGAVDELAGRWAGHATLRLLGPLAPYDFVAPPQGEG